MIKRDLEPAGLRFGGTSWVAPGTFADNLRYLSDDVSDMEIVLFDTPEHSNMPSKEEIRLLRELCGELDMSCTVHFPAEICVSCSTLERQEREDLCLRTVELFAPLDPFAWILHVVGEKRGNFPSAEMGSWLEKSIKSAEKLPALWMTAERSALKLWTMIRAMSSTSRILQGLQYVWMWDISSNVTALCLKLRGTWQTT